MHWSKYNTLFNSARFGFFVYNALSNTLIELDEQHYQRLKRLADTNCQIKLYDEGFYDLLREKLILVEPGEEQKRLLLQQYQRQAVSFDSSVLGLTIAPTLRCNFRCPYCFESSQKRGASMPSALQEHLLSWIRKHNNIRRLSVVWYGGEPLLAFDSICGLTENFKALDIQYDNAGLITNGYLLDQGKIAKLNDLKITFIQITLDGPREVHNKRRFLAGGGPTFDRILENISNLMHSNYTGKCKVRVNVDRNNVQDYLQLRSEMLERFKDSRLRVYPGHAVPVQDHPYNRGKCLENNEWSSFNLQMYHEQSIVLPGGLYPPGSAGGMCIATQHKGYVVGPEGELYKCWEDVGKKEMEVGNIHEDPQLSNQVLQARYVSEMDAYNDPECRECKTLPVCGGGCVQKRMQYRLGWDRKQKFCSVYNERLIDYLEAYIDAVRTKDICKAVLAPGKKESWVSGYRVIFPQKDAMDDKI